MAIPVRTSTRVEPRSQHVSDAFTTPFLQSDFDPAAYLNAVLPPLAITSARASHGNAVPLPELASQTQALLSQLSAQTTRLSNTLTQLTDEIIRSGGRLAYEVEVLRGETTSLNDALENGLKNDITVLAPVRSTSAPTNTEVEAPDVLPSVRSTDPSFLTGLRTLSTLRTRLESITQMFGAAMSWPVAPSEVASTASSSFISVSSPETTNRESKAKAYTDSLRAEIETLLATDGIEAAAERVEELNVLAEVWRGTVEEKARGRVVDMLAGVVEERGRGVGGRGTASSARSDMRYGTLDSTVGLL
ncbi:hypothetical protein B0A48_04410 [Cryoendolithus antarcticus]|uniref:Uncharacterized protein n=1 Tax=Cryoendolithus antarcticus TaxID=1507870 RepID=A0A1V8TFI8_9PEZI|nr:hypothetical protein B0A48_04410 [Cryoendolithus antarcticus]